MDNKSTENQYQTLTKYAQDLTEQARLGTLDPVIGRHDEIRQSSKSFHDVLKIILYSLASQAWAKQLLLKASHNALSIMMCQKASKVKRYMLLI